MPLSLLPVTSPADIPTLTHLHLDAFIRIPINHAIWPHGITDNVLGHAETSHRKALDADPSARYLKVVDDDTSAIIAFARWHVFATPEAESQRWDLKPRDWGKDVDLDVAGAFWVEIVRARRRMEGKAHCCELYLCSIDLGLIPHACISFSSRPHMLDPFLPLYCAFGF